MTTLTVSPQTRRDVYTCASCGYCRFNCPIFSQVGYESLSARGRMLLVKRAVEGKLDLTPRFVDSLYACTKCEGCSAMCPTGIDYSGIISELRREVVRRGLLPEAQVRSREVVAEHGNPFGEKPEDRGSWIPKKKEAGKPADDVYFVGCSGSYASNRIPKSALVVLDSAGHDVGLLGNDESCCGDPFFRMGETGRGKDLVRANVAAFREMGAKRVIASCPGCYNALKHEYPKEFKVLHMSELLAELVKSGEVKFVKPYAKKVIYSDGCDLGRHCGIYEAPREILKAIPGLELLEFDYNREDAACCGGPVASSDPDLAHKIAAEKIRESVDKGADVIATSCPMCFVNLKEGARLAGVKADIQAVPMLLPKLVDRKKRV